MKLATFTASGGHEIGIVRDDKILSITHSAPGLVRDMIDLISHWEEIREPLERLAAGDSGWLPLSEVHLEAPIRRPAKILAIGLNYADHIAETGREKPEHQVWFCKQTNSVNAPYDPIDIPRAAPDKIDYEVELVAVIGKRGRHFGREGAAGAVFGYCVGNDVSVRDWQRLTQQWMLGKSFDTHGPFGPWITTADEIGDPHRLDIRCSVNGEDRQVSNTRHLVFDVWAQIALLSEAMTLEPGDVIFTGTPGGVGSARKPPVYLREGDVVRCEIEELGVIEATMAAER